FGRLDQDHRLIERGISVFDNAQKNIKGMPVSEIRSLLSKFNLKADIIDRNASSISPGERARLQLAIIMANGANTLLLDEPTNHLDLEAQEQLEIALQAFNGTLLLVSHDREFIKNIGVNRIIEVTEGKVSENWDLIRLVD
ncbi:MAG: ATP-binding cassette domain-containing protein, partial [Patescibacteria group bacterium]|nr:ATP-binding cassette domain-containing protein [Patescibacteria group bacterium]